MSHESAPVNNPQDEPIGSPMNDAQNETRPYPENDPMRDLLGGRTAPLDTGDRDTAATDVIAGFDRSSAHSQDATTTESFAWTAAPGPGATSHAPAADAGAPRYDSPATPSGASSFAASYPGGSEAPAVSPTDRQSTPPRAATIVWGCILFLVAALAAVPAVIGETALSPTTILWIVVGFGSVLVLGGIIGAIVSTITRRSRETSTHNG
jgi:hypothetical protein